MCYAGVQVVGGLTRENTVKPGDSLTGDIILFNTGNEPEEVKIYKTDYFFRADGSTKYSIPGSEARSNSSWITLSPSRVTIPPREKMTVHYEIHVPNASNLTGTYWSLLMVEPKLNAMPEGLNNSTGSGVGIKTLVRYAIQMVSNVSDTGLRNIRFLSKKVLKQDGKKILQIDIENSGERGLTPDLWAELYDEKGNLVKRVDSGKKRIYPGTSVRYCIDLSGIPLGNYKTVIVADNGDDHIFGAQYDLTLI
jgi:hypothetical protein